MQTTSHALAQLDLLHRMITLHTVFGVTRHDRERLLQIANELTGVRTETLTAALGQIDIKIEKLRGGQIK
jgi:Ni,Fe-hydrogenase III large subunit